MNFGLLNFGADFLDPRNILDMIWHSQPQGYGRQDWSNPSFDSFVEEAAAEMNQAKRDELYEAATASMLEDYPAVFLFHSLAMQLRKPWVRGYAKNQDGTAGPFHWYKLYVAESNN